MYFRDDVPDDYADYVVGRDSQFAYDILFGEFGERALLWDIVMDVDFS